MGRSARLGLAGLLLWIGSCGGSERTTSESESSAIEPTGTDERVVAAYVDAIARRDMETVQSLRCARVRLEDNTGDLFQDQVGRFLDGAGDISFVRAETVESPPNYEELRTIEEPAVLRVWLAFDEVQSADPVLQFLGTEGGRRRICGWAPEDGIARIEEVSDTVRDLGPTAATLDALVGVTIPEGFDERDPSLAGTAEGSDLLGWEDYRQRVFGGGDYGGITVSATRFVDATSARTFAEDRMREKLGGSVEAVRLDAPAGASLIAVGAYSWTFVQPPSVGPYLAEVVLQYDRTVAMVAQSELTDPNAGEILALISQIDAAAR
jgi:hypothetical protein